MPHVRHFEGCDVVLDDRYAPIVISTFSGKVPMEAAVWHNELHSVVLARLIGEGQLVVSINDSTGTVRPNPDVRAYWADVMKARDAKVKAGTLGTLIVMNSPLMRGVVTAIGWWNEDARELETFATLEEAIAEAKRRLEAAGRPVPDVDPASYVAPAD